MSDADTSASEYPEPADLHKALASEVRRRRKNAGLTQGQLAAKTAYSREYTGKAERPDAGFPSPEVIKAIDIVLGADGELLALHARAEAQRHARRLLHKTSGNSAPSGEVSGTIELVSAEHSEVPPNELAMDTYGSVSAPAVLPASGDPNEGSPHERHADEATEALTRMQWFIQVNVDDDVLSALTFAIDDVIECYETDGPAVLARKVRALRSLCHACLQGHQHPKQREQLYLVASKLSGLLGYMAVNQGRPSLGRTYCTEAFQLASQIDAQDVLAWIRGTESLAAYYNGDYAEALELAENGQRYARGGPQAIRLALNGEARAHGKLHDLSGVRESVSRGFEALSRVAQYDNVGIIPCISFEAYDAPRAAANAATAYLSVGRRDEVFEYAREAEVNVEISDSEWSRALVRLDVATALVSSDKPEVERAATLGMEALRGTDGNPISSVKKRATELYKRLQNWPGITGVRDYKDELLQWSRSNVMSREK